MLIVPYQRAISTLGCAEFDLRECLALAARHGLDGVELRALGGTVDLPEYFRSHFGAPAVLAQSLGEQQVRVIAFATSLRLVGSTRADREKFLEFVPWADAAGAKWLRVFDGQCSRNNAGMAEAITTCLWWQKLRQLHGWRVDCIVETHDGLLNSKEIARFVASVPSVKILWDAHNTWRGSGEDPSATWRVIGRHVGHIHVKDSISPGRNGSAYDYVAPGQGEFPMIPLISALRNDFSGTISLESERLWHPELAALEQWLQAARAAAWW